MIILAIETSAVVASVAVMEDKRLICEQFVNNKLTHSQTLMPMIDSGLKASGISPEDVDAFAVSRGPGSFTGLRIGIGTAKGLAYALKKPIIGVSTLEALAYNLPLCPHLICPVMDARRQQVYNALYRFKDGTLLTVAPPRAIALEDLLREINEPAVFLGDGLVHRALIEKKLGDLALFPSANLTLQRASSLAVAAFSKEPEDPFDFAPEYLRKAQAERQFIKEMNDK